MDSIEIVSSVSVLLNEAIMEMEKHVLDAGMGESVFWYRGHADATWELQPTVLRTDHEELICKTETDHSSRSLAVLNNERVLNRKFLSAAYPSLTDISKEIRVYFTAQHHGLPTRLLDWSLNPLVALYFACYDKLGSETEKGRDGCVYRLYPRELPGIWSGENNSPPSPYDDIVFDFRLQVEEIIQDCLFQSSPNKYPHLPVIPVMPTAVSPRIVAQSSRFTFHPPIFDQNSKVIQSPVSLIDIFADKEYALKRYIIPSRNKKNILVELNRLGIHRYSLFPDLDNLALHLKTIYCDRTMYMPVQ